MSNYNFTAKHDPQSTLDYTIEWSALLTSVSPEDAISNSVWRVEGDDAMTLGSTGISGSKTSAFVSGGTVGLIAKLINTVTTSGGRTYERTIHLTVKQL